MNTQDNALEDVQVDQQSFKKTLLNLKKRSKHAFILAITVLTLGAVTAGVVFVQVAQELRSDAATAVQGGFPITVEPSSNPFPLNQPATLRFRLNTQGIQISGIQLSFVVDTSIQNIQVNSVPGAPVNVATHNITQVERGTLVTLIVIPPTVQPFSSTTDVAFAELAFTPTQEGQHLIEYDQSRTKIMLYGDADLTNQVAPLNDVSFQVATTTITIAPPTSTPTIKPITVAPTSTPRPTATVTQSPVVTQPVATVTSVPTATLTQAPLPTVTPKPKGRKRDRIIRMFESFF